MGGSIEREEKQVLAREKRKQWPSPLLTTCSCNRWPVTQKFSLVKRNKLRPDFTFKKRHENRVRLDRIQPRRPLLLQGFVIDNNEGRLSASLGPRLLNSLNRVRKEWWRSIRPSEIAFREERKSASSYFFGQSPEVSNRFFSWNRDWESFRKPALSSDDKNEFHLLKPGFAK